MHFTTEDGHARGICAEPYCGSSYDTRTDSDAGLHICGPCVRWKRLTAGKSFDEVQAIIKDMQRQSHCRVCRNPLTEDERLADPDPICDACLWRELDARDAYAWRQVANLAIHDGNHLLADVAMARLGRLADPGLLDHDRDLNLDHEEI